MQKFCEREIFLAKLMCTGLIKKMISEGGQWLKVMIRNCMYKMTNMEPQKTLAAVNKKLLEIYKINFAESQNFTENSLGSSIQNIPNEKPLVLGQDSWAKKSCPSRFSDLALQILFFFLFLIWRFYFLRRSLGPRWLPCSSKFGQKIGSFSFDMW